MKFLTIIGLTGLAAFAAWNFCLFATFEDANGAVDVQGGKRGTTDGACT